MASQLKNRKIDSEETAEVVVRQNPGELEAPAAPAADAAARAFSTPFSWVCCGQDYRGPDGMTPLMMACRMGWTRR